MAHPRSNDPPPTAGRAVIRRYRPGKDGNWLRDITADGSAHTAAKGDDASTWIAEVDGRAAGALIWRWVEPLDDATAAIPLLWVDPDARRRGLATQLYRRAVSEIRKQFRKADLHLSTLILQGDVDDEAARAFAASLKFGVVDGRFVRAL